MDIVAESVCGVSPHVPSCRANLCLGYAYQALLATQWRTQGMHIGLARAHSVRISGELMQHTDLRAYPQLHYTIIMERLDITNSIYQHPEWSAEQAHDTVWLWCHARWDPANP